MIGTVFQHIRLSGIRCLPYKWHGHQNSRRIINFGSSCSLVHSVTHQKVMSRPFSGTSCLLSHVSSKQKHQNRSPGKRPNESKSRTPTYEELMQIRRGQAERSVLIQVSGKRSCDYVYKYCSKFGNINKIFYESNTREYVLVEFETKEAALGMTNSAEHFDTANVPVESRVLYFCENNIARTISESNDSSSTVPIITDGPREVNLSALYNATNMQEQLLMYYHAERLTELETRLRYFVCSIVEDLLRPLFRFAEIVPYGSSANRLGRHGSDLDMVLNLNSRVRRVTRNSPFRYMTKIVEDERQFTQSILRHIGEKLQIFVSHIPHVQKIVHARVPIINFYHEATATSCDISVNNDAVVTMSKILYVIGESDPRFRPLMFALRKWAALNDLTLERPGPRFSNFMLTMMLVSFLQLKRLPTLPPFSSLLGTGETYTCENKIFSSDKSSPADELLIEFFDFYANFDFSANGLSLFRGELIEKPASSPLFIENPLDHSHNCAQNVHQKELEYLVACIRCARDKLLAQRTRSEQTWGLLNLVESRNYGSDVNVGVNVRNLFST